MPDTYVKETIKMIKDEIDDILTDDFFELYRGKVFIEDEQTYVKRKFLEPNSIFIVVKFSPSTIDFGQALLPVSINAVSEQNGLEVCQKLLFDFASKYTQSEPIEGSLFSSDDYVKQIWMTPTDVNNFTDISFGYRSFFHMQGTILIGKNSNPITELIYIDDQGHQVKLHEYMITFGDSFDVTPDTQPFYQTNGVGKSEAKTGSYSFHITLFKVNNSFIKKCIDIKRGKAPKGISTKFTIKMKDKFDDEPYTEDYLMINMTGQQNKGDLPIVSISFAR